MIQFYFRKLRAGLFNTWGQTQGQAKTTLSFDNCCNRFSRLLRSRRPQSLSWLAHIRNFCPLDIISNLFHNPRIFTFLMLSLIKSLLDSRHWLDWLGNFNIQVLSSSLFYFSPESTDTIGSHAGLRNYFHRHQLFCQLHNIEFVASICLLLL